MNIFVYELKAYVKSLIIWTVALTAILFILMSLYRGFASSASDFIQLMKAYPQAVLSAFGIYNVDDISSILFYYSFVFGFVLLAGAVQAMNIGVSLLSKETREKTADFLLSKPVTRTRIITAKVFSGLTSIGMTDLVYLIFAYLIIEADKIEPFSGKTFMLYSLSLLYVQLIFAAIGFLLSVIIPKIKSVVSVTLPVVFAFYIIGMLADALNDHDIYYLTPFRYFNSSYILANSAYQWQYILLSVVIIVLCIGAAYVIYNKKDIHAI